MRVLDHKVYVFRDYSGTGGLVAAEIQSVNGVPAGRILQTMLTVEHGDGESTTAGPWRIGRGGTFAHDLYLLAGIESPFRIRYVHAGKTSEATIEGIPGDKLKEVANTRYPQDRRPSVSATYKLLNHGSVGLLKVYGFGGKAEGDKPLGALCPA